MFAELTQDIHLIEQILVQGTSLKPSLEGSTTAKLNKSQSITQHFQISGLTYCELLKVRKRFDYSICLQTKNVRPEMQS